MFGREGSTLRRIGALTALVPLAGCFGGGNAVPQNYPALHYEYLTPLHLNVASLDVENQSSPPDGDRSGKSPASPADALERMARDRLIASGPSGTATFVVTEASITDTDAGVTERLGARLEITNASGGKAGFAEAHVSRTENSSVADPNGKPALYELTRQAMEDMNVEFEYQVRHTLSDWVMSASAAEAPVSAEPLAGGTTGNGATAGAPIPLAPSPLAPASLAPASVQGGTTAPPLAPPLPSGTAGGVPPSGMSPPPGFLSLPGGEGTPPGLGANGFVPPASQPGTAQGYPQSGYPQSAYPPPTYPNGY